MAKETLESRSEDDKGSDLVLSQKSIQTEKKVKIMQKATLNQVHAWYD